MKRSINLIGTAWKWIAGNPDHEDFITITDKMNNVLQNNNKQVIINALHNERINNITEMSNEIRKLLQENKLYNNEILSAVQYKIKIFKEELENLNYAIHWAKLGIINSLILSKQEINLAISTISKENLPFATVEDALNFAEVKILSDSVSILYIINIPLVNKNDYSKIILKPVKRKAIATDLSFNTVLKSVNETYGLKNICKAYNFMSICKPQDIVDLTNTTCIPNIMKSTKATCSVINNHHLPQIEEISTGIVILNGFNGSIAIGPTEQHLDGTFLIKFHNTSIIVNEQIFTSKEESNHHILPAIFQLTPEEKQYRKFLSLEMMDELHINNTNQIELLQSETTVHRFTMIGIIAFIITLTIITLYLKSMKNNTTKLIVQNLNPDLPQSNQIPEVQPPKLGFNNIPYF